MKFTSAFTATGAGSKTLTLQGSTAGAGEIAGAIVDNSSTNKTSLTKAGSASAALLTNGAFTVGRDITVRSGSSEAATLGGNAAAVSSFTGAVTLDKDVTLTAANGGTADFSGAWTRRR